MYKALDVLADIAGAFSDWPGGAHLLRRLHRFEPGWIEPASISERFYFRTAWRHEEAALFLSTLPDYYACMCSAYDLQMSNRAFRCLPGQPLEVHFSSQQWAITHSDRLLFDRTSGIRNTQRIAKLHLRH